MNVFITGANRGLGLGLVDHYLKMGANIWATCRNCQKANELSSLQEAYPKNLKIMPLSVTASDQIQQVSNDLQKQEIRFDRFFNNAGIMGDDQQDIGTPEAFLQVLSTNTVAPLFMAKAFLPCMQADSILINMSSLLGSITNVDQLISRGYAYPTSKAGLNMITKLLSRDFRPSRIAVVSISPGWVKTDMGGDQAPLSVDQSIPKVVEVVESITQEDTGKFLHIEHQELDWWFR